ncbi:hypothetical protein WA026_007722 [Henosepilachna vigintioctopunctata]|uniref:Uncharacterized protein n=1 Tax=Henosepilachna vigintioctopunctata TaxID=420089 RepID=A0AAW1U318_9CUCU
MKTMSNSTLKRGNVSASANVLMCKQWWKVCWMYGDQEKYYRQLYGKQRENGKRSVDVHVNEVGTHINNRSAFNGRPFFNDIVNVDGKSDGRIQSPPPRISNNSPGGNSLELHDIDE